MTKQLTLTIVETHEGDFFQDIVRTGYSRDRAVGSVLYEAQSYSTNGFPSRCPAGIEISAYEAVGFESDEDADAFAESMGWDDAIVMFFGKRRFLLNPNFGEYINGVSLNTDAVRKCETWNDVERLIK